MQVETIDPLLRYLGARDDLEPREISALAEVFAGQRKFVAKDEIILEGAKPRDSLLLVEGVVARFRYDEHGQRLLSAIHVPGDFLDLHGFLLRRMDHGLVALAPSRILFAPHERLLALSRTEAHLTRLLWMSTVVDAAIHRAWIVASGQKSAQAHLAHFFCEMNWRLKTVDLSDGTAFDLPITRQDCADLLGRSLIHVSRGLRALKGKGLMTWVNGRVSLLKLEALVDLAEFDPTYLSSWKESR